VAFDEDSDTAANHISTVFVGPMVRPGDVPNDCQKFHARGRRHIEREVCDLGDEQGLGRLGRETSREQPVG
jgi:hypothetical protein